MCTPAQDLRSNQDLVVISEEDDPEGVIARFVKKRSGVVTTDNVVSVYLAEQLKRCVRYYAIAIVV